LEKEDSSPFKWKERGGSILRDTEVPSGSRRKKMGKECVAVKQRRDRRAWKLEFIPIEERKD